MSNALPLKHPDTSSPALMTRRAWWLVFANLVIPGIGPLLAGNRRFGRAALRVWLGAIITLVVVLVLALVLRAPLLFVLTTVWGLGIVKWLLLAYGLWMLVTMIETVRQARLVKVDAAARGLVLLVAVLLGALPVFGGVFAWAQVGQVQSAVQTLFGGKKAGLTLPSDGRINIMVLGADRGEDREGSRPDSISVMSFDMWSGQLVTIGLPRLLHGFGFVDGPMRDMYGDDYSDCNVDVCYLNSVYTEVEVYNYDMYQDAEDHGSERGIEATRDAVEWITGLDIHYYVLVDMAGFATLIDAMGGVEVDVQERVGLGINDDGTNPDWQPPSVYIEPGKQVLNGEMALWYARSRYESTDYDRMQRQRQLQDAVIAQLPGKMASRSSQIMQAVDDVVQTDIPQGAAGLIADLALKSRGRDDNSRVALAPPLVDPEAEQIDYDVARSAIRDALDGKPQPEDTPAE